MLDNKTIKLLLIAGGVIGGGLYAKNAYDKYTAAKEEAKIADDPNANLASQMQTEMEKTNPDDDVLINLAGQVQDYNAFKTSYKKLTGKDFLAHLKSKSFVDEKTVRTIANIFGEKGGAVKPQSSQANAVASSKPNQSVFIITKSSVRIRSKPKGGGRFSFKDNVIDTVIPGTYIGLLNQIDYTNNGRKLFFDPENNIFFMPIIIFNEKNKPMKAYVAASEVSVTPNKPPKAAKLFSSKDYARTIVGGLKGSENSLI